MRGRLIRLSGALARACPWSEHGAKVAAMNTHRAKRFLLFTCRAASRAPTPTSRLALVCWTFVHSQIGLWRGIMRTVRVFSTLSTRCPSATTRPSSSCFDSRARCMRREGTRRTSSSRGSSSWRVRSASTPCRHPRRRHGWHESVAAANRLESMLTTHPPMITRSSRACAALMMATPMRLAVSRARPGEGSRREPAEPTSIEYRTAQRVWSAE